MRVKLVGLNEEMLEAVKGLEELIDFQLYNEKGSNNENLEISYGSTRLLFNKEEPTQLVYSTPQGLMVFDVLTHRISIADNKISVDYQLLNENKPIGDYDFRLIYHQ